MTDSRVVLRGARIEGSFDARSGRLLALRNLASGSDLLAPLREGGRGQPGP